MQIVYDCMVQDKGTGLRVPLGRKLAGLVCAGSRLAVLEVELAAWPREPGSGDLAG